MTAIIVTRADSIPRLAWLVESGRPARVLCGSDVVAFDASVFEGCWSGAFPDYGFADAENVFGSGLIVQDDRLKLVTATHTLEPVFVLKRGGQVIASNSLVFLVEHCGLELPTHERWIRKLGSTAEGIRKYERLIWSNGSEELLRFVFANVEISGSEVKEIPKVQREGFASFQNYRDYLVGAIRQCAENAADPARLRTYELISSMSSGYDSTAVAALSAECGCREAVSIRHSRDGRSDSGKPVAEHLGLSCTEVDRPAAAEGDGFPEAEFLAAGTGGGDYTYAAAYGRHLPGRAVTTGFMGDVVWWSGSGAEEDLTPNTELYKGDFSGMRLYEFRLRVGFIHIPVPVIGAVNQPDLVQISNSSDMAEFRLGTDYDRPIPRRILEEAGVPRNLFAKRKERVGMQFYRDQSRMAPNSRKDFQEFAEARTGAIQRARETWQRFEMHFWDRARFGPGRRLPASIHEPICHAYGRCTDRFFERQWMDLLFLWAVEKVRPRYRSAGGFVAGPVQPVSDTRLPASAANLQSNPE